MSPQLFLFFVTVLALVGGLGYTCVRAVMEREQKKNEREDR
jgi:hypothetical protein